MARNLDRALKLRLDTSLLDAIESFVDDVAQRHPGPRWSRCDAIRLLIRRGLDAPSSETRPPRPVFEGEAGTVAAGRTDGF